MAIKIFAPELLSRERPPAKFSADVNLKNEMRVVSSRRGETLVEINSSDFADAWYNRQRYEVDSGRLEVPTLYEPIYSITQDAGLPKNVSINVLGPGGVIVDEIIEGEEVHFVTLGESSKSVRIRHYAVGLEYDKDLIMFNELWNVGLIERAVGKAWNALLNHIHLSPILTATYSGSNLTTASAVGATTEEKLLHTLEDAINAASTDETNPRPGPYVVLTSAANRFLLERVLTRVPQLGLTVQTSAIDLISSIISYSGWSGTRGKKTVSYAGASSSYLYLIDRASMGAAFQSFVKQPLQPQQGESDMSRFILEQVIWDAYFGVYANPTYAVQKVAVPT